MWPTGAGGGTLDQRTADVTIQGAGITYHGGPVMLGTTTIFFIYYGSFAANKSVLENFARHLGGSSWFNINTTYFNANRTHISNSVTFGGSTTDSGSLGTSLSNTAIRTIVSNAISSGRLPRNTNAVYMVLTAPNVAQGGSGFCGSYCGWHTHATISSSDIKYAFVGDPARCPTSCEVQSTGPNGSTGADGMVSIIAHEFAEATSDPDLNAWFDSSGEENADKCAWTFGTESTAANGAKFNMTLGGLNYLVQQNWLNSGSGSCVKSH